MVPFIYSSRLELVICTFLLALQSVGSAHPMRALWSLALPSDLLGFWFFLMPNIANQKHSNAIFLLLSTINKFEKKSLIRRVIILPIFARNAPF